MNILFFELKKYVFKPSIIVCLVLFSLINFVKFFEMYYYFGGGRAALSGDAMSAGYNLLYEKYGGEITNEKIEGLKAELSQANAKLEKYGIITEPIEDSYCGFPYGDVSLIERIISDYEYSILYVNDANEKASDALKNIEFYKERSDYEVRKNSLIYSAFKGRIVDSYVKSSGWTSFFDYKFSSILSMLLISLIIAPIFASEKGSGFDKIIKSSGKTGIVVSSKLIAAFLVTLSVTLLFWGLDLLYTNGVYGLYCFDAPIYGISEYANCSLNITLFGAALLAFVDRLAAMLFFVSVTLLISSLCGNSGLALTVTMVFAGCLIIVSEVLPPEFNPLSLVYMSDFFQDFGIINLFGLPVLTIFFVIGFTVLLTLVFTFITAKRGMR